MTNTYDDNAPIDIKMYEELRCTRAVLERILCVLDEGLFVDYELEKFGKARLRSEDKNEQHGQNKP